MINMMQLIADLLENACSIRFFRTCGVLNGTWDRGPNTMGVYDIRTFLGFLDERASFYLAVYIRGPLLS